LELKTILRAASRGAKNFQASFEEEVRADDGCILVSLLLLFVTGGLAFAN
jgi:hypothetical protein